MHFTLERSQNVSGTPVAAAIITPAPIAPLKDAGRLAARWTGQPYTIAEVWDNAAPPCCLTCSSTLAGSNVGGYYECQYRANIYSPYSGYPQDCDCNYISLCSVWCTLDAETSQFASFYSTALQCSNFGGLTWGWIAFPFDTVTNPASFYTQYPSLSGTVVITPATDTPKPYVFGSAGSSEATILSTTTTSSTSTPTPRATDPIGFFSAVKPGGPDCIQAMSSACSGVFSAATSCYVQQVTPDPGFCFCSIIQNTSCQEICTTKGEPVDYLRYIKDACSPQKFFNGTSIPTQDWTFYQSLGYTSLFPWTWNVTRHSTRSEDNSDGATQCPSRFAKLGSFALINLVTLISTVVFSRRDVIYKLTRGKLGKLGSPWWPIISLGVTACSIGVTFVCAIIVQHTPGYVSTPAVQLALLWLCRPRLGWLAIVLARVQWEEGIYVSLAASSALSETVKQALAFPYMGRTANFARVRGFYLIDHVKGVVIPKGSAAYLMYAAALLWLISICFVILLVLWVFTPLGSLCNRFFDALFSRTTKAGSQARHATSELYHAWSANLQYRVTRSIYGRLLRQAAGHYPVVARVLTRLGSDTRALPAQEQQGRRRQRPRRRRSQIQQLNDERPPHQNEEHQPTRVEDRLSAGFVAWTVSMDWLTAMGLSEFSLYGMSNIATFMVLPFAAQWMFWVGFVDLTGDLYCPPRIGITTLIWCISAVLTSLLPAAI